MTTVGYPDDPNSIADGTHHPRNASERGHVIQAARHVIRYPQSDPHVDFIKSMHFLTVANNA
ncbi:MAG: hypothetical protein OXE57_02880 [Alphaproteobacteria bacterium]|nr:hypothetical protein [Alphaproteobacteria bacterium]